MNAVEVEQGTSRVATKLTYRFASFGNTHAPETATPQRICLSEIDRRIDEQEQKQKQNGEHK